MSKRHTKADCERVIAGLSAGLPKPGPTSGWPCANSHAELLLAQRSAQRGQVGIIIGPDYSLSPSARRAKQAIERLEER